MSDSRFLRLHIFYPLFCLVIAVTATAILNLDQRFADFLYAMQGGEWQWKNLWLTETLLHKGGRLLSISLAVATLLYFLISLIRSPNSEKTKSLSYLLLALAGSNLLVGLLKASLGISCPWEFARYGGHFPYGDLITQLMSHRGKGCFPAAHACAGYSWVALYFFGLSLHSKLRWIGLAAALTAGILFGLTQQLRGAHFISHDICSLSICWFFSLFLYLWMFQKNSVTTSARDRHSYEIPLANE